MEIIQNTEVILNQLTNIVKTLSNSNFTKKLNILNGSSVGQHIRHIIEFYVELNNGYDTKVICYDNRNRNPDLEGNQSLIISKIKDIISIVNSYDLNKDLKIKSNHGLDDSANTYSNSSVMRELVYALDHTVHHLAIIKIGMQVEFPNIVLNKNIGVAPSTIRNENKVCVQ